MNHRYIEQSPSNVIWRNLSINPYEQNVRQAASFAITVGMIIGWTFPGESCHIRRLTLLTSVAFIGILSNVSTLTETFSWLSWINGTSFAKKVLQGVISGVLPPVLLALLNELLPTVLRREWRFWNRIREWCDADNQR